LVQLPAEELIPACMSDLVLRDVFLPVKHTETNVTGSQTAVNAVGGDIVNFTCYIEFSGAVSPLLDWSLDGQFKERTKNASSSWESESISEQMPDGPATVSYTCRVIAEGRKWENIYFWKATNITVSCWYLKHALCSY